MIDDANDDFPNDDSGCVSVAQQLVLGAESHLADRGIEVQESTRSDSEFIIVVPGGRCYRVTVTCDEEEG